MSTVICNDDLELVRVTDLVNDRDVRSLYENAFPKIEQKPYRLIKLYSRFSTRDFFAICNKDRVLAHAFLIVSEEYALLYYFAVDNSLRGTGIGSRSLSMLQAHYNRPMLVIMEPVLPDSDDFVQRRRRKAFYERSGFVDTGLAVTDWSGTFSILSNMGRPDSKKLYRMLRSFTPFDRHLAVFEGDLHA